MNRRYKVLSEATWTRWFRRASATKPIVNIKILHVRSVDWYPNFSFPVKMAFSYCFQSLGIGFRSVSQRKLSRTTCNQGVTFLLPGELTDIRPISFCKMWPELSKTTRFWPINQFFTRKKWCFDDRIKVCDGSKQMTSRSLLYTTILNNSHVANSSIRLTWLPVTLTS